MSSYELPNTWAYDTVQLEGPAYEEALWLLGHPFDCEQLDEDNVTPRELVVRAQDIQALMDIAQDDSGKYNSAQQELSRNIVDRILEKISERSMYVHIPHPSYLFDGNTVARGLVEKWHNWRIRHERVRIAEIESTVSEVERRYREQEKTIEFYQRRAPLQGFEGITANLLESSRRKLRLAQDVRDSEITMATKNIIRHTEVLHKRYDDYKG